MKSINKVLVIMLSTILVLGGLFNQKVNAQSKDSAERYKIVINCKSNKLGYFKDSKLVKEFPVATGKKSTPTPKGKFKIVNKIKNRPYYSGGIPGGDPRNPLGDRWLGLKVGYTYGTTYGIHGNNNESSIGKYISGGCIRMHNKDVRWLFEQIPTGTEVIIYNSSDSFVEAAKKYGITLNDEKDLNSKQKDAQKKFREFVIYGPMNNPIIDLNDKNSIISNFKDTDNILRTYSEGKPTDRQLFINAWNKLTDSEKKHSEMKKIYSQYEKIVEIVEAAQSSLKFYEDIKLNSSNLILDYNKSKNLNSISNMNLGARGKAKKEYDEATKYGEQSNNSKRMQSIYTKYMDASNFLEISKYLEERNVAKANSIMSKIKDDSLRNVAKNTINEYRDIERHWAEKNIIQAMSKNWVETTNIFRPNDSITRAEFVTIVNNAFGFDKEADISFKDVKSDAWFYKQIKIAVGQGYISGYENNTFRPNEFITREEAASIVTTINNNKDSNLDKLSKYLDAYKVSSWAKSSVEGAIEAGYMGVGSDKFNPKSNITRSETIVTIERVVK